jgi:hypothetical protein
MTHSKGSGSAFATRRTRARNSVEPTQLAALLIERRRSGSHEDEAPRVTATRFYTCDALMWASKPCRWSGRAEHVIPRSPFGHLVKLKLPAN